MFIPSLFLGGALGAVIILILGFSAPYAPIIGTLIGACIAWVAYDVKQIVREAPNAARTTLTKVTWLLRPRFFVWMSVALGTTLGLVVKWDTGFTDVVLLGAAICIATVVVTLVSVVSVLVADAMSHRLDYECNERLSPSMHDYIGHVCIDGITHSEFEKFEDVYILGEVSNEAYSWLTVLRSQVRVYFGLWWRIVAVFAEIFMRKVGIHLFLAPLYACVIAIELARFTRKLFVLVHSEKRRMVFVDSGMGVLVSYAVLRWQFGTAFVETSPLAQLSFVLLGGACAVVLGVVNHEIVARRVLKLSPT